MIALYLLLALLGLVLLLLLIALLRTLLRPGKTAAYEPAADGRAMAYAQKLARMIRHETLSSPENPNREVFLAFHRELETLFPLVHRHMEKTEIDGNLLFYWKGQKHDKPIVLMSHQDVVPAEGVWEHPPFSGDLADGLVWGRGTSDTKASLMCFFQACEELLEQGYVPRQDVYLASSCTEEHAGSGAAKLVNELQHRGVKPFLVCDEGGGIIRDPIAGVKGNFAMVGVFEKGKGDVRFTARSGGGHASAPPRKSPIARLAAFVNSVEKKSPFRKKLSPEVAAMMQSLAPYASFPMRLLFGNLWLFGPLLKLAMPAVSAQAAAMLQTTCAFTMQKGSDACNVLPQEASVWANLRFIPHQGMEESLSLIRQRAEGFGLEMEVLHASDFTPPVDIRGEAWQQVTAAIEQSFPGLPHSPYVMTGATDCCFWQELCPNCIRFAPVIYGPMQMKGMHGLNETIGIDCLPGGVDFYKNLIGLCK